jgi:hypothetical protein
MPVDTSMSRLTFWHPSFISKGLIRQNLPSHFFKIHLNISLIYVCVVQAVYLFKVLQHAPEPS